MKPLKLVMSAFGPFANRETIDFTRLGDAPLFLINGPTGAGKTCILDAICFALYGKTTGSEREARDMRCDSAESEKLTEVSFEFKLGEKRYKIRRVPEQSKPKVHGDGVTKVLPEAQLYELLEDGDDVLIVEKKVTDATDEIKARTGLNVDQFRQVMVLPQGQFRQLLMASSADREKIFSQLFQTHAYQKIETALKEQAKGIQGKVESHRSQRAGMLQTIEVDNDQALIDGIAELTVKVDSATKLKNEAQSVQQQCSKQLNAAKLTQDDFNALAKLEAEAEELNTFKSVIADRKIVVDMAEQALLFTAVISNKAERLAEQVQAEQQHLNAQQRSEKSEQSLTNSVEVSEQLPQLRERLSEQQKRQHYLNGLSEHLLSLDTLSTELHQTSEAERRAQDGLKKLQVKSSSLKQELQALDEKLPLLQQQRRDSDQLREQQKDGTRLLDIHIKWQSLDDELKAEQANLNQYENLGKQQKDQAADAEKVLARLNLRWHQGQAVLLAQSLNDNEACPVCGSLDHPSLAVSDVHIPSADEKAVAENELKIKQDQLSKTREAYSAVKAKIESLTNNSNDLVQQLNNAPSRQQLEQTLQNLNQQLQSVKKINSDIEQSVARKKECQDSVLSYEPRLINAQTALTEALSQQAKIKGQQQTLEQQLPEEFRSQKALQHALESAQAEIQKSEQSINRIDTSLKETQKEHQASKEGFETAKARLQETQTKVDQVESDFSAQLKQSNFDSQEQIEQYSLSNEQLLQHKQDIEAYTKKFQENSALIKQLKEKLQSSQAPDLIVLEDELNASIDAYQVAEKEWQELSGELSRHKSTQKAITEIDQQSAEMEKEYAIIGTLSDVANGQTGNKISLQRFVLSVLLDDVLLAAGERLQLMSKGRYLLLRKHDKAKGNKASGLELEVEDSYTSKTRPVSTLSGGESFMAALSMALGLSDVVQAYAGGIKLDTLFIDEGFGSLDQESLDLAVRTLVDLQSSGRMVGVISHVSELKEQIGTRLDVLKGVEGSRVSLVVP